MTIRNNELHDIMYDDVYRDCENVLDDLEITTNIIETAYTDFEVDFRGLTSDELIQMEIELKAISTEIYTGLHNTVCESYKYLVNIYDIELYQNELRIKFNVELEEIR